MPKLYLIPNAISDPPVKLFPQYIAHEIKDVRVFFVEEAKSARRLLKDLDDRFPLQDCHFIKLDEHTRAQEMQANVKFLQAGDCAIISQAGCPCVADPGSDLVYLAHQHNIQVIPLVGPSAILLALMASGLSGQHFTFNGYLPKGRPERIQKIKTLQERSLRHGETQIFMETPYRNQGLFDDILASCHDKTRLCVACDISGPHQIIKTMRIQDWKKTSLNIDKKPALFLIQG